MGCGSGYVICSLALLLRELGVAAQLMATDINPQAAAATRATLAAHEASGEGEGLCWGLWRGDAWALGWDGRLYHAGQGMGLA